MRTGTGTVLTSVPSARPPQAGNLPSRAGGSIPGDAPVTAQSLPSQREDSASIMPPPETGPKNKAGPNTPVKSSGKRPHESVPGEQQSPSKRQTSDSRPPREATPATQGSQGGPQSEAGAPTEETTGPITQSSVEQMSQQPRPSSPTSNASVATASTGADNQVPVGIVDPQRFPRQAAFENWLPDDPEDVPNPQAAPDEFNKFYREFAKYVSYFNYLSQTTNIAFFFFSEQEAPARHEMCMVERRECRKGPLSKTAAQREFAHMKKVIVDRNRRITNARIEETKRMKAAERARRAAEAAEAKRIEEEERQRLAAESAGRRQSLPRAASSAIGSLAEPAPPRERMPYARLSGSDVQSVPISVDENEQAEAETQPGPVTAEDLVAGLEAIRPQPRAGQRPVPTAFQQSLDAMENPDAHEVTAAEMFNAILANQTRLANQNAIIMRTIQSKNEVCLLVV